MTLSGSLLSWQLQHRQCHVLVVLGGAVVPGDARGGLALRLLCVSGGGAPFSNKSAKSLLKTLRLLRLMALWISGLRFLGVWGVTSSIGVRLSLRATHARLCSTHVEMLLLSARRTAINTFA